MLFMCNKGVVKINTTIILRIKKLLALSESSNEYEAKSAMLKAQ